MTTKREILANVSEALQPKIIANNTVRYYRADGTQVIRLHHTDIIKISTLGHVTLNTGGWQSHTTKERMNDYVSRHVAGFRLWQDRGVWFLCTYSGTFPYFEGVELKPDGTVVNPPKVDVEESQRALRKKILTFCRLVKTVDALPTPDTGDCWYCCMRDSNGKTMGEDDPTHLLEHIEEGYLHGSLLVNAMRFRGYSDDQIRFDYSYDYRDTFQRALRSYLYRKLGLAA